MIRMSFKKLKVWQKGMEIAKKTYQVSAAFPRTETYGLTSQLRRAAISVPSNIAEGSQRTSPKDFANFILIARGSLAELETQIILATELGFIQNKESEDLMEAVDELSRMLHSFHGKIVPQVSSLVSQVSPPS